MAEQPDDPTIEEAPAKVPFAMHRSTRDDYFAHLLRQPGPMGLAEKVRFDHSTQLWHIWDGVRWAPDRTTAIYELMREKLMLWLDDKKLNPDADSAKVFAVMFDAAKKASVLKMLASMPEIAMSGAEWDQHPELMGFNNGVLNLRDETFDYHPDPALLISRSTGVDWDDQANFKPFADFVDDIMSHDPDMTDYILRVLGYAMIGTNREQQFWMWVGSGQNGKGVLARTVSKALGDYAATPPDTLYMQTRFGSASSDKPRPELLKLEGVRFASMSEPQGGHFNEEMIKAHTGNDYIEARTLHSKMFKTFQPTHKIIFLTNNPPRTEDVGPSMQRRVRMVWFLEDYRSEERNNRGIEEELQLTANLQGALRLMAHAAMLYLRDGLTEPQKVIDWSRQYIEENDPVKAFVTEMCVEDPTTQTQAGPMFKAFDGWCDRSGAEKMSATGFGLAMGRKYTKKVKTAGTFYMGIRLKNTADRAAEEEQQNAPAEAEA